MSNKILIADDSKLVASLVKSIFESQGDHFQVIIANDGQEAIDKSLSEQPDIILMDWQMPVMNGLDALKELKKNQDTKDIPVIMLTASENTSEAFEYGAYDFIQKPFQKPELIARANAALDVVNSKKELKQKTIEVEIQKDKLKLQKDIMIRQKKEMNQLNELAVRMKSVLYPPKKVINSIPGLRFFLSLPVDEMESNFFLLESIKKLHFIVIGYLPNDGAISCLFNSLVRNSLYNILNGRETLDDLNVADVLAQVKNDVNSIESSSNLTLKLDLIACLFDAEKKVLYYSGINVPLYVFKNGKLTELKTENADKGLLTKNLKPTQHKVQLALDDNIYILNDGFNEYVTGVEKTFLSDEIIELLTKIHQVNPAKQEDFLKRTFENWRSDLKQVNDILALGFQVK